MAEETFRESENWSAYPTLPTQFRESLKKQFLEGRQIRESFFGVNAGAEQEKPKIITLVREPVSHIISSYFQNIETMFEGAEDPDVFNNLTPDLLIAQFNDFINNGYFKEKNQLSGLELLWHDLFHVAIDWLDRELKPVSGIDVYQHEFNFRNGYRLYFGERADVALIRFENLDRAFSLALKDLLGVDVQIEDRINEGSQKNYGSLYIDFKSKIKIDRQFLTDIYGKKYSRHFYTGAEIEAAIRRWSKA